MALNLKEIQNIDGRITMLIHGFNREARQLFPQDVAYYNIPSLVNHICLLFYWQKDYFALFDNEYVTISDDKMKATTIIEQCPHWITIYGYMIFDKGSFANAIIEYEMVATSSMGPYGATCAIGIVSAVKEQENTKGLIWFSPESLHKDAYTLHLSPSGDMFKIGDAVMKKNYDDEMYRYLNGDKIRMTVNIPDKSVTFWNMTRAAEIGSYLDIDFSIKYRLAVSMDIKCTIIEGEILLQIDTVLLANELLICLINGSCTVLFYLSS